MSTGQQDSTAAAKMGEGHPRGKPPGIPGLAASFLHLSVVSESRRRKGRRRQFPGLRAPALHFAVVYNLIAANCAAAAARRPRPGIRNSRVGVQKWEAKKKVGNGGDADWRQATECPPGCWPGGPGLCRRQLPRSAAHWGKQFPSTFHRHFHHSRVGISRAVASIKVYVVVGRQISAPWERRPAGSVDPKSVAKLVMSWRSWRSVGRLTSGCRR
jgi:hypothetical protein